MGDEKGGQSWLYTFLLEVYKVVCIENAGVVSFAHLDF